MNQVTGIISEIITEGALSIVRIKCNNVVMSSVVIDTPETNEQLKVGVETKIIFKETEVILGKGNVDNISLRNKLPGIIQSIESGNLLSKLGVETSVGLIYSIITKNAVTNLDIKVGDEVIAMIKTNEVMLSS